MGKFFILFYLYKFEILINVKTFCCLSVNNISTIFLFSFFVLLCFLSFIICVITLVFSGAIPHHLGRITKYLLFWVLEMLLLFKTFPGTGNVWETFADCVYGVSTNFCLEMFLVWKCGARFFLTLWPSNRIIRMVFLIA